MSGQPVKTQADINRFKNEYLETLDLEEENNDLNLQSNRTYLQTGQLPPSTQMMDTRTNTEKLADVEKMKLQIAEQLRPIAEPSFAFAIVNGVMNSPLNLNNSLFNFLAQRAQSIAELLSKSYTVGIKGDTNDLEQIIEFIKNMYAQQQGTFTSTKSYMNSTVSQNQSSKIISADDIDNVILSVNDIIKNIELISNKIGGRVLGNINVKLFNLRQLLYRLKTVLPSTSELSILINNATGQYNPGINGMDGIDTEALNVIFDVLKELPKYSVVITLLNKILQYVKSNNFNLVSDGVNRLVDLFEVNIASLTPAILAQIQVLKNRLGIEKGRIATVQHNADLAQQAQDRAIMGAQHVIVDNPVGNPVNVNQVGGRPQVIANASETYIPPTLTHFMPEPITLQAPEPIMMNAPETQYIKAPKKKKPKPQEAEKVSFADMLKGSDVFKKRLAGGYKEDIHSATGDPTQKKPPKPAPAPRPVLSFKGNPLFDKKAKEAEGYGIKKRRVGRPRGSGIVQVPKMPTFIGFGINEINQKQLDKGILKIRRNTRSNYADMPSKHISSNLQNIIKTIVGGGMPKYEELGKLDNDEKEYLNKIVSRSDMSSKLSIPAPSKDQQEKDIHSFEVLKGEIMSGNDSVELVKKFKLLVRKLTKQGLLPKADVDEIIDTLLELGY